LNSEEKGGRFTSDFCASTQRSDSFIFERSRVRTSAITTRWAKTVRAPSTPSEVSARLISRTTTGPRYHSACATPECLPRLLSGACSAISDQLAGMSAPTARPTIRKPTTIIQGATAKNSIDMPSA